MNTSPPKEKARACEAPGGLKTGNTDDGTVVVSIRRRKPYLPIGSQDPRPVAPDTSSLRAAWEESTPDSRELFLAKMGVNRHKLTPKVRAHRFINDLLALTGMKDGRSHVNHAAFMTHDRPSFDSLIEAFKEGPL